MPQNVDSVLTKSQQVLVYLINKLNTLGISIDGRKKLIKLMFLIEHYNPLDNKLHLRKFIGNKFIIYRYGVYSFDVRGDYFKLDELRIITEDPIIKTKQNDIVDLVDLSYRTKSRIDDIIKEFGLKRGSKLESETLRMLGLDKSTKRYFIGVDVREFIRNKNSTTVSTS